MTNAAARFREAIPDASDEYVVVPASRFSWLRNLLPGLWTLGPRIVAIGPNDAVLLSASTSYTKVKAQLWRGPKEAIACSRPVGDRVVVLTVTTPEKTWKTQIDGTANCRLVLDALEIA